LQQLWKLLFYLFAGTMDGPSVLPPQISSEVTPFLFLWMYIPFTWFSLRLLDLPMLLQTQWPTGDGVVVKGRAYGIRSIRVDGNDALAMYSAVHTAREMAIREQRPILIEVNMMC